MKRFLLLILVAILANTPINSLIAEDVVQYDPRSGFSQLIKESTQAVVNVSIVHNLTYEQFPFISIEELLKNLFEGRQIKKEVPQEILSAGSGFVIDESGIIVTNYHVVHNAKEVYITFSDNRSLPAKILGVDPQTDLAVLKVEVNQKLPCLEFGDSDTAMVGDWVVAIGNPFGLGGSASIGIISARARDLNIGTATEFLQTDAAINKGNSGGPLFNIHGKVIGINTAIISTQKGGGSIGVGFAIPSNSAVPIIKVLSQGKKVEHGWLGVVMQPITEELVAPFKLKDATNGALITNIIKGSPAEKAKLLPGDVILEFNGTKVNSISQLHQLVLRSKVNSEVKLTISRNGNIVNIPVKIGKFENPDSDNEITKDSIQSPELGLTVGNIKRNNMITSNNVEDEALKGVVILNIDDKSDASTKNIRKGDIILQINQSVINNIEDFKNVMKKMHKDKSVALLLSRDNVSMFVTVKLKH